MPAHISLNTAASFVTNTNWQYYGGEYTMSYLTQMAGLAVQNFVSAGGRDGGARRRRARDRAPLDRRARQLLASTSTARSSTSCCRSRSSLAVILISQGVVQTFHGHATATTLEGAQQTIARGPAASQIAIKQLGTNGGGFYNSNSAVPFENPNGLTNFLELLAILLIPAAQVFMFGKMVLARRHAWMVFAAMFVDLRDRRRDRAARASSTARRCCARSGVNITQGHGQSRRQHGRQGGPLRHRQHGALGDGDDATPRTAPSTAATTRSPPAGGAVPLVNIFLGEVIFGGVGSGLYGMFFYILIAVFVAGLMVGRTPEWLGKKIEAREIKLAALGALFVPTMVLVADGDRGRRRKRGLASIFNPGAARLHRGALRLRLAGRTTTAAPSPATARRTSRPSSGTVALLPRPVRAADRGARDRRLARGEEDRARLGRARSAPTAPTFVVLLVGVIALTAGLMIFPALTLGPIVEGLMH